MQPKQAWLDMDLLPRPAVVLPMCIALLGQPAEIAAATQHTLLAYIKQLGSC